VRTTTEKFEHVRQLAALRDYVLISSTDVAVEVRSRQPDGTWVTQRVGPGHRARLASLDLDLDELYRDGLLDA
jgi:hypothetical protein